jgi:hypothetical protein
MIHKMNVFRMRSKQTTANSKSSQTEPQKSITTNASKDSKVNLTNMGDPRFWYSTFTDINRAQDDAFSRLLMKHADMRESSLGIPNEVSVTCVGSWRVYN